MINENKISVFILELIKKTRQEKIHWYIIRHEIIDTDKPIVNLVYQTNIKDKNFRIYKYKTKSYQDEFEWEWIERIRLELVDDENNSLYEFPYDYSLMDLYEAIREKTSKISEILDDILNI